MTRTTHVQLRDEGDVTVSILEQGILDIVLNRPQKLNAITYEMYDRIFDAVREAADDPRCQAITLRGAGRAFSAGFDLGIETAATTLGVKVQGVHDSANRLRWQLWDSPKPVVAGVHGYCLAGAFELTLPCDFTIATASCMFGEPEILFGEGPAFLMVPWLMNHKQAKRVLLLGDQIDAATARDFGLVSEVVPDDALEARVLAVARRLSKVPPSAVRYTKAGINRAYEAAGMTAHINAFVETGSLFAAFGNEFRKEFARRVEEDGVASAAAWRADYYAD